MKLGTAIALAAWFIAAPAQVSAQSSDPTFGPRITIERIEVYGNETTAERLILRALPVAPGDALRAGDARLQDARAKVLALGYFRDVKLSLSKGTRRGRVILRVDVVERGTLVLNRIYLGTTELSPWWVGLDAGDRNFLGSGIDVGGAFVYVGDSAIAGGSAQWAGQLRMGASGLGGSRFGAHGAFTAVEASEPYRIAGDFSDGAPANFAAFDYSRIRFEAGASYDVTALSQLTLDARVERVHADVPPAPVRELPSGRFTSIDLGLRDGTSRVASVALGFDRDTRPDPILPFTGDHLVVLAETGGVWFGGDYNFARFGVRYERWFPVAGAGNVLSVHATGGAILGHPALFDRFYVGDVNRLLSPRALGLVVSTLPSLDVFGTAADETTYGELVGLFELEYARRLFRKRELIFGGDLFVGAGVFALATRDQVLVRDRSIRSSIPIDLLVDIGLRLDTEIGIFELSLSNGLGRIPL